MDTVLIANIRLGRESFPYRPNDFVHNTQHYFFITTKIKLNRDAFLARGQIIVNEIWSQCYKTFYSLKFQILNKPECLSLASLSRIVYHIMILLKRGSTIRDLTFRLRQNLGAKTFVLV
jgi:hypothetical protein